VIDIIAASLMSAAFVEGRNDFTNAGINASLGVKAFGFAWGSVGALLVATFGFCGAACGSGRRTREYNGTTRTGRFWRGRNKVPADAPPAAY
jgi:hypothetical protein